MTTTVESGKQPQIVDLGSISKKEARLLKRGVGSAMDEVRQKYGKEATVIVLYRKKRKRVGGSRKLGLPFPFPFA